MQIYRSFISVAYRLHKTDAVRAVLCRPDLHSGAYERTTGFAEIALGQMKALRHANNPRNYEIWYTYATGYHPALNAQINAISRPRARSLRRISPRFMTATFRLRV